MKTSDKLGKIFAKYMTKINSLNLYRIHTNQ